MVSLWDTGMYTVVVERLAVELIIGCTHVCEIPFMRQRQHALTFHRPSLACSTHCRFHAHALGGWQVLNGLLKRGQPSWVRHWDLRARRQALLWKHDFSLERNERANASQVGFIKPRPGTRVRTVDNYRVPKGGSGATLTRSRGADEHTHAPNMGMI